MLGMGFVLDGSGVREMDVAAAVFVLRYHSFVAVC